MAIRVDARNSAFLSSSEPFIAPWMVPGMIDPQADNASQLEFGAALAASRGVPFYLNGQTWAASRKLYFPTRTNIQDGCFDYRALPPIASNNNYLLNIEGSISTYVATLAVDALADEGTPQTITLSSGDVAGLGGLTNNDLLFITGVGQPWFQNATSQIPTGQEITVKEATGNIVTMYGALRYSFAAGAQVRKVTPVEDIILKDIDLIGSGTLVKDTILKQGGINLNFYRRAKLENVNVNWVNLYGVLFNNGCHGHMGKCSVENTPGWYGIGLAGAGSNNTFEKNYLNNNRHGFTATGSSYGIPTDFTVHNNKVKGREAGLDAHPGCDKGTYSNNYIDCDGDITENRPHGLFLQGREMHALANKIRGNVAAAVWYQPATMASTGLKGVFICKSNVAESRNPLNGSTHAYIAQAGAGAGFVKVPIGTLEFDSAATGPWAGLFRLQAGNGAGVEAGWRATGVGRGHLNTGILLQAISSTEQVGMGGANIEEGVIHSPVLEMADGAADFGIGFQAQNKYDDSESYHIHATVTGAVVKNAKTALRRLGAVGGSVELKAHGVTTDATNLVEGFQATDVRFVNGYGIRPCPEGRELVQADSGWTISNAGATGPTEFYLYPAVEGLHQRFVCSAPYEMKVINEAGDVIYLDGTGTDPGGYITADAVGSIVDVKCQDGTNWFAQGNVGWEIGGTPGPVAYFFDFMTGSAPANTTVARAGAVGPRFDITGTYENLATNTLRFDYNSTLSLRGAHNEASVTNVIRNSALAGGATGSPGTVPTNIVATGTGNGITRTITANVVRNGINGCIFAYAGTPIADATIAIAFEPSSTPGGTASVGQTWTSSFYPQLDSGDWTNVGLITNAILQYNSSSVNVGTLAVAMAAPTDDIPTGQRSGVPMVLTAPTVDKIANQMRMNVHAGLYVEFAVWIGLPNLTQEGQTSSPIETTGAAATRASEVITHSSITPGFYDVKIIYESATTNLSNVDITSGSYNVPRNANRRVQSVTLYEV